MAFPDTAQKKSPTVWGFSQAFLEVEDTGLEPVTFRLPA
jgi:hypothetical protein